MSNIENQLIEVLTVDNKNHESRLVARINRRMDEDTYVITYMVKTDQVYEDYCSIYKYSDTQDVIENESICTWFDSTNEETAGYKNMKNNIFITMEDWEDLDEDYVPCSDDDSVSSDDESVVDSDDSDDSSDDEESSKKKSKVTI